jgi:hypothetical protein
MPSFAVKQPNGLYASFSTIVGDFTSADHSRDEAFAFWRDKCGVECAETKLRNADDDGPCGASGQVVKAPDGLGRWRSATRTVALLKGSTALWQTLQDFDMPEAERERWLNEAVASIPEGERLA